MRGDCSDDFLGHDVEVDAGGGEAFMAEQDLDGFHVGGSGGEEQGCGGMPGGVRGDVAA